MKFQIPLFYGGFKIPTNDIDSGIPRISKSFLSGWNLKLYERNTNTAFQILGDKISHHITKTPTFQILIINPGTQTDLKESRRRLKP